MEPRPVAEVAFLEETDSLSKLSKTLADLDGLLGALSKHFGESDKRLTFEVASLEKKSPMRLILGSLINPELAKVCFACICSTILDVNHGKIVDLPPWLLERFKGLGRFAIKFNDSVANTGIDFDSRIDNQLKPGFPEITSIVGRVDTGYFHGKLEFMLYPDLGDPLRCKFEEGLFEQVRSCLRRRTEVTGIAYTRPGRKFPDRMDVEKMEAIPDPDPSFDITRLRGILSEADFAGLSSVDYVRKIRSEFDASLRHG